MKPIQTEEQIEQNFKNKRAACIAAQAEIDAAMALKIEADRLASIQAQNSKEGQIRALYNSYVASMQGKHMQIMDISEFYSNYKNLVLNQQW